MEKPAVSCERIGLLNESGITKKIIIIGLKWQKD
jgi:hypothetical protein